MKTRLLHLDHAWAANGARDGKGGIPALAVWWWDERLLIPALVASVLLVNRQTRLSTHTRQAPPTTPVSRTPGEPQRLHADSERSSCIYCALEPPAFPLFWRAASCLFLRCCVDRLGLHRKNKRLATGCNRDLASLCFPATAPIAPTASQVHPTVFLRVCACL